MSSGETEDGASYRQGSQLLSGSMCNSSCCRGAEQQAKAWIEWKPDEEGGEVRAQTAHLLFHC